MSLLSGIGSTLSNIPGVNSAAHFGSAIDGGIAKALGAPGTAANLAQASKNIANPHVSVLGYNNPVAGVSAPGAFGLPSPTSPQAHNGANPSAGGAGSGYGYAGSSVGSSQAPAPAVNPNQFTINQDNAALGRLDNQQNIGLGNILSGYNDTMNQLNQNKQAGTDTYNKNVTQGKQDYVSTKNTIGSNAGSQLNNLLRLLGAHGAGGSSTALISAPQAVARDASLQRSQAGNTFAKNAQSLDTNYNTFLNGYNNSVSDLGRQKTNQENDLRGKIASTRAGLLSNLATLQSSLSSAQPYVDQANSLMSTADSLGANAPVYQASPFSYSAPNLDSYTVNPNATPQLTSASNGPADAFTPYLNLLLGRDKNNLSASPLVNAGA